MPMARLAFLRSKRQMGRQSAIVRRYVRRPHRGRRNPSAHRSPERDGERGRGGEGEAPRHAFTLRPPLSLSPPLPFFFFLHSFVFSAFAAFSPLDAGFFAASAFFSPAGVTVTLIFWSIFC